ncbi:MAG: hypothetical protein QOD99_651 [Chthoniobacter sp.]|jgi:hypothetical protein|nr:hypothetical protein [Chthoniobacter sp.]
MMPEMISQALVFVPIAFAATDVLQMAITRPTAKGNLIELPRNDLAIDHK